MKFNREKIGFTLGETLVVLFIIIVLTVFSISMIRPKAVTTPALYWRAYDALNTAAYNGWHEAAMDGKVFGRGGTGTPYPANTGTSVEALCRQLADAHGGNRDNFANYQPNRPNPNDFGYINATERHCNRPGLTIPTSTTESFTNDNLHFIASNHMRFYISRNLGGTTNPVLPLNNLVDNSTGTNVAINPDWHIIFVDLDGEKGINSMRQPPNPKNTADIVAFALVLDEERPSVIPIGVPSMEKKYMTAVVRYVNDTDGHDRMSPSLTYKEALIRAFGTQVPPQGGAVRTILPERLNFERIINSDLFNVTLPGIGLDAGGRGTWTQAPVRVNGPGCMEDIAEGACGVIIQSYTGTSNR